MSQWTSEELRYSANPAILTLVALAAIPSRAVPMIIISPIGQAVVMRADVQLLVQLM